MSLLLVAWLAACGPVAGLPNPPADTEDTVDTPVQAPRVPQAAPLRRLTTTEHRNALLHLVGEPLPPTPLPPDTDPYLFPRVGAVTDAWSDLALAQLDEAARIAADAALTDPNRRRALVGCTPTAAADDPCARAFLSAFGRRAWRRPLTVEELDSLVLLAAEAAMGEPWAGLSAATAAVLQAPSFVYHSRVGSPSPEDPSLSLATAYETADALASLLWASLPDDALLDAAENGSLLTTEGILQQGRRMFRDPRAKAAIVDFFVHWLALDEVTDVQRDATMFPTFNNDLARAMAAESRLLVEDVVLRQDTDLRTLLTTRQASLNAQLAAFYGVEVPGADEVTFVPTTLPETGTRLGLLTRGAFLATFAHQTLTSPTLRGKFVRERLLCGTVPPPPPDVATELPVDASEGTLRERLAAHRTNPDCAACHARIDPPGLAFEGFDAIGAVRDTENGLPVDTSGELDGLIVANAAALSTLLAADERFQHCAVQQLFRHAHGRLEGIGDRAAIAAIEEAFVAGGWRFEPMLLALITDPSFRTFTNPAEAP